MGNINKVIAIKIKPQNSNEYVEVPITTLAEYVYWGAEKENSDFNLKQHIIGNIKKNNDNIPIPLQKQIDNLNSNKANIKSPNFTGVPTIEDGPEQHDVNTEIATKGYINNQITGQLKRSNLKDPQVLPESSQITNMENRQYSVILDGEGKLSVNVPWENTEYSQIKNIWSGKCETNVSDSRKIIILDDLESFQDQLIENNPNIILAIYFEKGNTANNPKLVINNQQYDIQIDISNFSNSVNPSFVSSPGLKFFIYKKENNEEKFLLSTIDYLTLINNLNNSKANINSPNFSGYPKINDVSIATVNYVDNKTDNQLTTGYLQKSETIAATAVQVPENENIPSNKTYPVVFDANNKLSVVVPWVDADATIENIQGIWTGFCSVNQNTIKKTIVLDNKENNFGQLFSIIEDEPPTITPGATLLIYFRNGNEVTSPIIEIEDAPVEIAQKPILYQSSSNSFSEIDNQILCQWGPGLKIFTYVTYDNGTKDGWVINSFDGLIIKNLNDRLTTAESNINKKANINSPQFTGTPTVENTPDGNNLNQITNVNYVKNECKKILNADENYAFQLKDNNNENIFTVDWKGNTNLVGNANGVNLNCFSTTGILKSQSNDTINGSSTIIGKYNKVTYTTLGLTCGEDKICSESLLVGGNVYDYDSGNPAFLIGNGTDNNNRSNAFEVSWGGSVYMPSRIYINRPDVQLGTIPSSNYGGNALILRDKNQKSMGVIGYWYGTDNWSGIAIAAERNSTFNSLRLLKNNAGQAKVFVSHPSAWRNALGLNNTLDLTRFASVKKTNVEIQPNSVLTITTPYTPPSGFTYRIIAIRIDETGTTNAKNPSWCFSQNAWTADGQLHASVRNVATTSSTVARITCNWEILLRRTAL